jgi:hypothetical protein
MSELVVAAHPDLDDLNAIRLSHDWSFPELARAMAAAGYAVKERTLYYLLRQAPPGSAPRDTTLHQIRRFVEYTRAEDEQRALERAERRRDREEREERQRRVLREQRAAVAADRSSR